MNTTDIELDFDALPWQRRELPSGTRVGDMLATIFAGQQSLMETYDPIERRNGAVVVDPEFFGELDDRKVQMRIKDLSERVTEELMEAMNCLKNKPWKDSFVGTDVDHFQEELADTLHFFVELLITAGVGPEDIFKMYFRKFAVNQFRQDSRY